MVVSASAADNKPPKPPKAPPAPQTVTAPPKAMVHSTPPHPVAQQQQRANDDLVEKLAKMPPTQRQKALSDLPADRRAKVESGLDRWSKLSPQQKAYQEKFRTLPPETQKRIRELSNRIKTLPKDRKGAVQAEIQQLRNMPPAQRQKILSSPEVKKNFSHDEQEILKESPNLLPQSYL